MHSIRLLIDEHDAALPDLQIVLSSTRDLWGILPIFNINSQQRNDPHSIVDQTVLKVKSPCLIHCPLRSSGFTPSHPVARGAGIRALRGGFSETVRLGGTHAGAGREKHRGDRHIRLLPGPRLLLTAIQTAHRPESSPIPAGPRTIPGEHDAGGRHQNIISMVPTGLMTVRTKSSIVPRAVAYLLSPT